MQEYKYDLCVFFWLKNYQSDEGVYIHKDAVPALVDALQHLLGN